MREAMVSSKLAVEIFNACGYEIYSRQFRGPSDDSAV